MTTEIYLLIVLLGVFNVFNGLYMLYDPYWWYLAVPTVPATGPYNQHFVRDIGISHFLLGFGYILGAFWPRHSLGLWGAATAWLTMHAAFHAWEIAVGICGTDVIIQNGRAVYLPAFIGLIGVAWIYANPPAEMTS